MVQLDAWPLDPTREREIRSFALYETGILKTVPEQRPEAGMLDAGIEIAHYRDDASVTGE